MSGRDHGPVVTDHETSDHEKTSIMLVLTRKETQSIRIGEDIIITVVQSGSSSVKIGIEAPRDIRIVRGELETYVSLAPTLEELGSHVARELKVARVGAV